jgi:hypothetical protein
MVAMALPPSLPGAPVALWRSLFWIGILGMATSVYFLMMANYNWTRTGPFALIGAGALAIAIGVIWLLIQPNMATSTPTHVSQTLKHPRTSIPTPLPKKQSVTTTKPTRARNPSEQNTMGSVENNQGIVTQGQTGDNTVSNSETPK